MNQLEVTAEVIKGILGEILELHPDNIHLTQDFWDEQIGIEPMVVAELVENLERLPGVTVNDEELAKLTGFDQLVDLLGAKLAA